MTSIITGSPFCYNIIVTSILHICNRILFPAPETDCENQGHRQPSAQNQEIRRQSKSIWSPDEHRTEYVTEICQGNGPHDRFQKSRQELQREEDSRKEHHGKLHYLDDSMSAFFCLGESDQHITNTDKDGGTEENRT